jgi:hypothetical protein
MKITALATSVLLAISLLAFAPVATAAKGTFKNCAAFNKQYSTGVARSGAEANAASARLMERPIVSKKVYAAARKANKKLGTPADGVLCEVPVPKIPPSKPLGMTAIPDAVSPSSAMTLTWQVPAKDGNSPVTGYVISDGTRSFTSSVSTYTVTGLTAETAYTFFVTAKNVIGVSQPASVRASTQRAKLVLPENSGWQLTGTATSSYLRADATVGRVLPLGNAAELGVSFYGSTCSGEWYESAFIGVEFLNAGGNVLPGPFGFGKELLGYSAGRSDFSSAGCGGETVDLKDFPGAVSIRVVDSSGSIAGTVALFAGRYL